MHKPTRTRPCARRRDTQNASLSPRAGAFTHKHKHTHTHIHTHTHETRCVREMRCIQFISKIWRAALTYRASRSSATVPCQRCMLFVLVLSIFWHDSLYIYIHVYIYIHIHIYIYIIKSSRPLHTHTPHTPHNHTSILTLVPWLSCRFARSQPARSRATDLPRQKKQLVKGLPVRRRRLVSRSLPLCACCQPAIVRPTCPALRDVRTSRRALHTHVLHMPRAHACKGTRTGRKCECVCLVRARRTSTRRVCLRETTLQRERERERERET